MKEMYMEDFIVMMMTMMKTVLYYKTASTLSLKIIGRTLHAHAQLALLSVITVPRNNKTYNTPERHLANVLTRLSRLD